MKKIILGISFLMMAAFAGSANAQCAKENCSDKTNCSTEQCDKKDCKKNNCKDCKECKKGDCKKSVCSKKDCNNQSCDLNAKECKKGPDCKMPRVDGNMTCPKNACPFDGLNLSDTQKEQIKDLDNALKASRKEMKEAAKSSEARINPLERRQNEIQLRSKYLSDLKNILSPEQYTEFLQNFYVNQLQNPAMKAMEHRFDKKAEILHKAKIDKIESKKENK